MAGKLRIRRASVVGCLTALLALSGTASASGAVAVFPLPGARYETTATQIVFRGIAPSQIGPVQVVGSMSGAHPGGLVADSDGQGASFIPATPFRAGETVTVTTGLPVIGGKGGRFRTGR